MAKNPQIIEKKFRRFLGDANGALQVNLRDGRSKTPHLADSVIEAARKRLHESADAAEALEAIREIVSNLLGCESMLLLRFDRNTEAFTPFWSFGIDASNRSMIDALEEPASYCAAMDSSYIAKDLEDQRDSRSHPKVTVFVPIRYEGQLRAVLVLLRFLPQKLGLDMIDNEIFRVLSDEAGNTLFCQNAAASPAFSPERNS